MKTTSSTIPAAFPVIVISCVLTAVAAAVDPANPPSKVENAVKEADLPLLKLTARAAERLDLKTSVVELKPVPQTRPFAATVLVPLAAGDTPLGLAPLPLAAPDDFRKVAEQQALAEGAVAAARATLSGADTALARATKLATDRAGSERVLDEARTQVGVADATLKAAEARRALLGTDVAAALKEARRWVVASVASTELDRLDGEKPVSLRVLGTAKKTDPLTAKPVVAPPSASAAGTVELYYELHAAALRPGQRVQLDIPVKDSDTKRLVLPWSAVLFDPQGGAWVYEETAPLTYVHRRVSIHRVAGTEAVLEAGPPAGSKVVSKAAAELFGAEFGGFK